jgi:hypothetical protein
MKNLRIAAIALIAAAVLVPGSAGAAATTERVSVTSAELEATGGDSVGAAVSADGRFIAFSSAATDLVAGDGNGKTDVFVRDRASGTTERVSLDSSEDEGNNVSDRPAISGDGRFVSFYSLSNDLVPSDSNAGGDVFVRDRLNGTTERVSVDSSEGEANNSSGASSITPDGRYVAFASIASDLAAPDGVGWDIFVRDRQAGTTEVASVPGPGALESGGTDFPSISDDGNLVAFESSKKLTSTDATIHSDVFLRDRTAGTTTLLSVSSAEVQSDYPSYNAAISGNGLFVAFATGATNLAPSDPSGYDVYLRDVTAGTTERIGVSSNGTGANNNTLDPAISADGRFVAFHSSATNLGSGDTTGYADVFLRDRQFGTTERVSQSTGGVEGNQASTNASISADGGVIGFESMASNLVTDDTNAKIDVFQHAWDIDGDGVSDYSDNCPTVANTAGQGDDDDVDWAGNACDAAGTANADCNQAINSVDALKILRNNAGLSVAQSEPCKDIGQAIGSGFGQADVDCNNSVNSVDALKVLRATAGLSVSQQAGCDPPIGP